MFERQTGYETSRVRKQPSTNCVVLAFSGGLDRYHTKFVCTFFTCHDRASALLLDRDLNDDYLRLPGVHGLDLNETLCNGTIQLAGKFSMLPRVMTSRGTPGLDHI